LRSDWQKAAFFAADLGHWVADGHMPFHITRNYDGQFTGNEGIHGRYESGMINEFENNITYTGKPAVYIKNMPEFIFEYLYTNYRFLDSVLIADNHAQQVAGNTSSASYNEILWGKTSGFTTQLFSDASFAFASLLYTAWVNAGSLQMNKTQLALTNQKTDDLLQVFYSGFLNRFIKINYTVPDDTTVNISVYDVSGIHIETLINSANNPGTNTIKWRPVKRSKSIYFVVLKTENTYRVKKVII